MLVDESVLFLITARGGSKGIPGKNIKPLDGLPLIMWTLNLALEITDKSNICVSTDADEIIDVVEDFGFKVDFKRPADLATDSASSQDVILHALDYYSSKGKEYDAVCLLQPTSPFRKREDILNSIHLFKLDYDAVLGVKKTNSNPYYVLFEVNEDGYLEKSKKSTITRRQDSPDVYEINGAIYIFNTASLRSKKISDFQKIVKYEMGEIPSLDIDSPLDWLVAEAVLKEYKLK